MASSERVSYDQKYTSLNTSQIYGIKNNHYLEQSRTSGYRESLLKAEMHRPGRPEMVIFYCLLLVLHTYTHTYIYIHIYTHNICVYILLLDLRGLEVFILDTSLLSGEGNGTPLQYSCLENPMENPMEGGAWWAAVHGIVKSQTRLSDFTFTFHFHALEKEMATDSSVLAWRIPGTGKPGGLPSMGSHRVVHD